MMRWQKKRYKKTPAKWLKIFAMMEYWKWKSLREKCNDKSIHICKYSYKLMTHSLQRLYQNIARQFLKMHDKKEETNFVHIFTWNHIIIVVKLHFFHPVWKYIKSTIIEGYIKEKPENLYKLNYYIRDYKYLCQTIPVQQRNTPKLEGVYRCSI